MSREAGDREREQQFWLLSRRLTEEPRGEKIQRVGRPPWSGGGAERGAISRKNLCLP